MAMTDVSKEIGARWKQLDASGRVPYEAKAAVDKKR